jgi:hypothetical protein
MSSILSLKINNKNPLELNELTNALNALAKEYDYFVKNEFGYTKIDRKLEIKKLEQGSLIIDLAAVAIPLMDNVNVIYDFGKHLINTLDHFVGKTKTDLPSTSKRTCDNLNNFINPIANDIGSSITININNSENTSVIVREYDNIACNAAQNHITKYKQNLLEEEPSVQRKQAFYWISASFAKTFNISIRDNTDKGIIEKFDKKAHKVIFENETDRTLMTKYNPEFQKDWQELVYIVDVEIIKIQDVIKTYKILAVHYEDTFDPQEES